MHSVCTKSLRVASGKSLFSCWNLISIACFHVLNISTHNEYDVKHLCHQYQPKRIDFRTSNFQYQCICHISDFLCHHSSALFSSHLVHTLYNLMLVMVFAESIWCYYNATGNKKLVEKYATERFSPEIHITCNNKNTALNNNVARILRLVWCAVNRLQLRIDTVLSQNAGGGLSGLG